MSDTFSNLYLRIEDFPKNFIKVVALFCLPGISIVNLRYYFYFEVMKLKFTFYLKLVTQGIWKRFFLNKKFLENRGFLISYTILFVSEEFFCAILSFFYKELFRHIETKIKWDHLKALKGSSGFLVANFDRTSYNFFKFILNNRKEKEVQN